MKGCAEGGPTREPPARLRDPLTTPPPTMTKEEEIKTAFTTFNKGMQTFLDDLNKKYGSTYPGISLLANQLRAFTSMDPARRMPAQMAYPMYAKYAKLIEERDVRIFTEHDIGDLKSRAGVDPRSFWLKADDRTKEAIWRATEDRWDELQDIHELCPFDHVQEVGMDEKKVVVPPADSKSDGKGNEEEQTAAQKIVSKKVIKSLKGLLGDSADSSNDSLQSLLSRIESGAEDAGSMAPPDPETLITLMNGFVSKVTGGGAGADDDDEDEDTLDEHGQPLSEKEIMARRASRTIEEIQRKNRLKHVVGTFFGVESLTRTTDPAILEAVRKEEDAEKERLKNPESTRNSGLCASANYKILALLERLTTLWGNIKSSKDGRILFPQLQIAFDGLLARFKAFPNDPIAVTQIGAWAVTNARAIKVRDDALFLKPTHPWLVEFKCDQLWKAMSPSSRETLWTLAARPIQLCAVHRRVDVAGLSDVTDLLDGFLGSQGLAYDSDGSQIKPKTLLDETLFHAASTGKLSRIQGLFNRMSNPADQGKTVSTIVSLLHSITNNGVDDDEEEVEEASSSSDALPSNSSALSSSVSPSISSSSIDPRDSLSKSSH